MIDSRGDCAQTDLGLRAVGLSRRFGGEQAVADAHIDFRRGSIHGIVGQNGAGKSTVAKMIAGLVRPDSGYVEIGGEKKVFTNPRQALAAGVTLVTQELALVPMLTVAENVMLGRFPVRRGFIDRHELRRRFDELEERFGFGLQPEMLVAYLSLAQQQQAEILRAVADEHQVVIFDEPTSSLSKDASRRLYEILRSLADGGVTCVLVSHFLEEVLDVCDAVTVMRDGEVIRTSATHEETSASLVQAMVGKDVKLAPSGQLPDPPMEARARLSLRGFSRLGAFHDIDLDVMPGEIVALVGLIGAGRTEVLRSIIGLDSRDAGSLFLDGVQVLFRSTSEAVRAGVMLLPENRKEEGLFLVRSVRENITAGLAGKFRRLGLISHSREKAASSAAATRALVKLRSLQSPMSELSGGNQQKAMFARSLIEPPQVLLADEPTRGVDVISIQQIHELLLGHARRGAAVLVVTSEIEEALAIARRIVVMRSGRLVGEHLAIETTQDELLHEAFGTANGAELIA
ncbi:MAG: ATP-binding cassette domain-containing protein [Gammaproteobacteria bacterium]|nr:ATP-binding cassette domain-containing protein [Gammaproteobacteria bacterium]